MPDYFLLKPYDSTFHKSLDSMKINWLLLFVKPVHSWFYPALIFVSILIRRWSLMRRLACLLNTSRYGWQPAIANINAPPSYEFLRIRNFSGPCTSSGTTLFRQHVLFNALSSISNPMSQIVLGLLQPRFALICIKFPNRNS